jgi:hypothetical protein
MKSLVSVLTSPGIFFSGAAGEEENLTKPALIVFAGAVVAAVAGYFSGSLSARMLDSAMAGMGSLILIAAIVAAFIMTFVVWLIWAGAFFLISKLFRGTGSFNRCLEVVGYGYVPQVIGSVIAVIVAVEYLPKVAIPALTSAALTNPQQIQDATTALMQDPAMVEFTQISAVISMVFLLWSASIWIFGIKQARNITMRDAAICVGIPVILLIIYQLYNLAGM